MQGERIKFRRDAEKGSFRRGKNNSPAEKGGEEGIAQQKRKET